MGVTMDLKSLYLNLAFKGLELLCVCMCACVYVHTSTRTHVLSDVAPSFSLVGNRS